MFVDLWLPISPPDSDLSCILQRSAAGWRHRRVWVGATAPPALPCLWTACFSSRSLPPPSPSRCCVVAPVSPIAPPTTHLGQGETCKKNATLQKCKVQIANLSTNNSGHHQSKGQVKEWKYAKMQSPNATCSCSTNCFGHHPHGTGQNMKNAKCEMRIANSSRMLLFLQSAWLLWQNYLSKDVNICRVVIGLCTI